MCERTFKPLEDYIKFIRSLPLLSLSYLPLPLPSLSHPSLPFHPPSACSLLSFATYLCSTLKAAALCWCWFTTIAIMLLGLWEGTAVTLNPGCVLSVHMGF